MSEASGSSSPTAVVVDNAPELDLLHRGPDLNAIARALADAPIVTYGAMCAVGELPNRGLLGRELGTVSSSVDADSRVYVNTGAAWTGIVLGEQGSGRSHTTACLLEACTLNDPRVGKLDRPMATLVCTYDELATGQPCTSVALANTDSGDNKVTVLVAPRRLKHMRKIYAGHDRVSVIPLSLRSSDISPSLLLRVFENESPRVRRLVRTKLLKAADAVNYSTLFKDVHLELSEVEREAFHTCTEFLEDIVNDESPSINLHFESGRLVILDLTDPLASPLSVANLVAVVTHAFSSWNQAREKVALLDNVHSYLPSSSALEETLVNISKRTHSLNLRLILSAHEPAAVSHTLLDAASFVVCHKMASSLACDHLARFMSLEGQRQLIELFPGEAVLFGSGSLVLDDAEQPIRLGAAQMTISVRERVTSATPTPSGSKAPSTSTSKSTSPALAPKASLPNSPPDNTETSTLPTFSSPFVSASPLVSSPPTELVVPQPSRAALSKPDFFSNPPTPTTAQPTHAPSVHAMTSAFPVSATTSTLSSSSTTSTFPSSGMTSSFPTSAMTSAFPTSGMTSSFPAAANTPVMSSSGTTSNMPTPKATSSTTSALPTTSSHSRPSPRQTHQAFPDRFARRQSSSAAQQTSSFSEGQMFWTPSSPPAPSRGTRPNHPKVTVEEVDDEPELRVAQALDSAAAHILEQVTRRAESRASDVPPALAERTGARTRERVSSTASVQTQTAPIPMPMPPPPAPAPVSTPLRSGTPASIRSVSSMSISTTKRFGELLGAMEAFAARGETRPTRTDVAAAVGDGFLGTGFVTFRGYALAAEKAGLVRRGTSSSGKEYMELVQ
ncbi:hypothetical protein EXIGLDRAFT_837494 [Exidia glandulosa HHB12029]|uniref:Uncharacterized protein n=1 Tax=Exidia glandulosa HHB12029 TaxID=1314781 RepID=A0A165GS49_EXIGL|nr:hypothetical protein EXIGLDRAFT_837494 [Exidia glandulosa HHB12029]